MDKRQKRALLHHGLGRPAGELAPAELRMSLFPDGRWYSSFLTFNADKATKSGEYGHRVVIITLAWSHFLPHRKHSNVVHHWR